ncbi:type II toxin-antitoxin system HicA family toxin [bacterium]|nr:type II toxin-antitoxin system HicA family toxin [bacterium]
MGKIKRAGSEIRRQEGSHILLGHPDGRRTMVAMHTDDMPQGTLRQILKQCGFTLEDFRKL